MAESDPIRRMKAAARRSAGKVTVETQRNWYLDELEQDIGRDPQGLYHVRHQSSGGFGLLIVAILFFGAIAFAVAMAVLLWRDGRLDAYLPARPTAAAKARPWTLAGETDPEPNAGEQASLRDNAAPPNQIEPPAAPPAPPPAAKADSDKEGEENGEAE